MKVFLNKKVILLIIITVAIAVVAIVSVNTVGRPGFITDAAEAVVRPLKGVASSVARSFESIYGSMYKYDSVLQENERLKAQINEMRQDYREYIETANENDRLKALLELKARDTNPVLDSAVIISPGASNWSSTFTINRGADNSEVAAGDSVITETGILVGRISQVGSETSVCVSIIDTTFSAGALIGKSGDPAMATGDFTLMRRGLCKLDFLSDDIDVVAGDAIVTSGKGGTFAPGLIIGEVTEVLDHLTGVGRYAAVKPSVDLETLMYVYVITDFEIVD